MAPAGPEIASASLKVALLDISTFLEDINLLGGDFAGPSWNNWKVILKAALAEPLTWRETQRFQEIAHRNPPRHPVRELWLAVGRRGGKDSIASAIATYLAVYGDFAKHLRRGERALVLCLAVDRVQASIVFGYIRSYFEEIPLLTAMLEGPPKDGEISLTTGVDIVVATNSFRALRGRTIACAILDEIAYWRDENYANPDVEVYNAVMPSLITLRQSGALLVAISTVYRRAGLLYDRSVYSGKDNDDILYILAGSAVFNPTLLAPDEAAEIVRQCELDPERGAAEWHSEFRSDLSNFITRDVVDAIVERGVQERRYDPEVGNYCAFTDESGGSGGDSSTLSIAHLEAGGEVVQDLLRIWRPPFKPSAVISQKSAILKEWKIYEVTGDRWASGIPGDLYEKNDITYHKSEKVTSDIYVDFLHLANSRRVRLLDNQVQKSELLGLERKTAFGGKETIGHHAYRSHDDAINSGAGACVLAAAKRKGFVITAELLEMARRPPVRRSIESYRAPRAGGVFF
jgi:hypothetical protein